VRTRALLVSEWLLTSATLAWVEVVASSMTMSEFCKVAPPVPSARRMALSVEPVDPATPPEALRVLPEKERPVPREISSAGPVPEVERPRRRSVAMMGLPELVAIMG
jgi:hypothetical protein